MVLRFSYYISMTFLTMPYVILLSMLMILFSNCDKCSDLWQKLELICELEFHLRDTADWVRKKLFDFSARTSQYISLNQSNNTGSIDVKMDEFVFEEILYYVEFSFSSELDWCFYIISVAKTESRKIAALIRSMKFLSREVALYLHKSTMCTCLVLMSRLVPVGATWQC